MASTDENLLRGGDIKWDDLYITNVKGTRLDILAICAEINLYEDIYSYSLYGSLVVVDTRNILSEFPIIGQERLFFKCHTPTAKETTIDRMFKIVKVSDIVVEGAKRVYTLHFISADAYSDLIWSSNKSYYGRASAVIKEIIKEMRTAFAPSIEALKAQHKITTEDMELKLSDISGKDWNEDGTGISLVSPQWGAFECIGYMTKYAAASSGTPSEWKSDFLFYDTTHGYKFRSLRSLFEQTWKLTENGKETIIYYKDDLVFDHSSSNGKPSKQLTKVIDLRYVNTINQLKLIPNRGFGQTVYSHNLLTKQFNYHPFNIHKQVDFLLSTTKTTAGVEKKGFSILGINSEPDKTIATLNPELSYVNDWPDHEATSRTTYPHRVSGSGKNNPTDFSAESIQTRLPLLNKMEMIQLDIDIWGRTWLNVGDIVNLTIGKYAQTKDMLLDGDDEYASGRYLITSIHHRFSQSQHMMTMQVVTDSSKKYQAPMTRDAA